MIYFTISWIRRIIGISTWLLMLAMIIPALTTLLIIFRDNIPYLWLEIVGYVLLGVWWIYNFTMSSRYNYIPCFLYMGIPSNIFIYDNIPLVKLNQLNSAASVYENVLGTYTLDDDQVRPIKLLEWIYSSDHFKRIAYMNTDDMDVFYKVHFFKANWLMTKGVEYNEYISTTEHQRIIDELERNRR